MSFRSRLTAFFVLIVVVPMVGVGFLVFRLIGDSQQGKTDARASGLASAAASLYNGEAAAGRTDAETLARELAGPNAADVLKSIPSILSRSGLARVTVRVGTRTVVDAGSRTAIAPGTAIVKRPTSPKVLSVSASELTAATFTRDLVSSGVGIVVSEGRRALSSTVPIGSATVLPSRGDITVAGATYRVVTQRFPGFGGGRVTITLLSSTSSTSSSVQTSQVVAAVFIAAFLLLAFAFAMLAARELEGQLGRFLEAARRLGSGDFSSPVPIEGHDEFAALGEEFNKMSSQLEHRLQELAQERARLRESVHRVGQTLESNLDRPALLDLTLRASVDAVQADFGRLSARSAVEEPLAQIGLVGSLDGLATNVLDAERAALNGALNHHSLGEAQTEDEFVVSVRLGALEGDSRAGGLITVGRKGRPFNDDDRDILRSLAAQATLALENVELHYQVRRQAVTDELTGLANHGRFQDLLDAEMEQVRRYRHPAGLIMVDLDDFKSINDTYGHQQGDIVLKHVARVLRESSREADTPARYGGEEMAVILPHTDVEGAHAIAERVRTAIEALRIPRLDEDRTVLRITASLGVAASREGHKDALIADADGALYSAKRQGKNRTVVAQAQHANVFSGE